MKSERIDFYCVLLLIASFSINQSSFARQQDGEKEYQLPKKISRMVVQQIIPAIREGDDNTFLHLSMPLFDSNRPERLEAIDQLCTEHSVATVSERFTELVVGKTQQGIAAGQATSSPSMARVVLYGIADELDQFAKVLADHELMQDPLEVPAEFHESETLFWDFHVLHNEFDNAKFQFQLADSLLKQHEKAFRKNDEGDALVARFTAIQAVLQGRYDSIEERAADLRLQRFKTAHDSLVAEENEDDFELLLTSAMTLEDDGEVLTAFLTDNDSIALASLQVPDLLNTVTTMLASGRKAGGDVTEKANLFRNGLRYWVRGRYGAGPLAGGLVKGEEAVRSIEKMEMLSMPREIDKPISNFHSEDETTPGYDRRHYSSWATEYRPVEMGKATVSTEEDLYVSNQVNIRQETFFT